MRYPRSTLSPSASPREALLRALDRLRAALDDAESRMLRPPRRELEEEDADAPRFPERSLHRVGRDDEG